MRPLERWKRAVYQQYDAIQIPGAYFRPVNLHEAMNFRLDVGSLNGMKRTGPVLNDPVSSSLDIGSANTDEVFELFFIGVGG